MKYDMRTPIGKAYMALSMLTHEALAVLSGNPEDRKLKTSELIHKILTNHQQTIQGPEGVRKFLKEIHSLTNHYQ